MWRNKALGCAAVLAFGFGVWKVFGQSTIPPMPEGDLLEVIDRQLSGRRSMMLGWGIDMIHSPSESHRTYVYRSLQHQLQTQMVPIYVNRPGFVLVHPSVVEKSLKRHLPGRHRLASPEEMRDIALEAGATHLLMIEVISHRVPGADRECEWVRIRLFDSAAGQVIGRMTLDEPLINLRDSGA